MEMIAKIFIFFVFVELNASENTNSFKSFGQLCKQNSFEAINSYKPYIYAITTTDPVETLTRIFYDRHTNKYLIYDSIGQSLNTIQY